MHSQARITPQLLLNGNHCLNEGVSMHIITALHTIINELTHSRSQTFQLFIELILSNIL